MSYLLLKFSTSCSRSSSQILPPSVHVLYLLNLVQGHMGLEPLPAVTGREAEYTSDRWTVHHRVRAEWNRKIYKFRYYVSKIRYLPYDDDTFL